VGRLKSLKPRVQARESRIKAKPVNYGRGRTRYEPGRDARRKRVYMRDKGQCRQCGEKGVLKAVHLHSKDRELVGYCDHYVPLAQGGPDTESNQWMLCCECNDRKNIEDSQGVVREPRDFGVYDELVMV